MVITVFRARVRPEAREEYARWAEQIGALARRMPGYLSHKEFVAGDGEQVMIVEFRSEQALRDWSAHREHVEAKRRGRSSFFLEYRIQTCTVQRDSRHPNWALLGAVG